MSVRHRRVSPLMWDDPWFVDQDDAMRNLWILILTGPQVLPIPGLQLAGPASLAETLRRSPEPLGELFHQLLVEGKVEFDSRCRLLRLPQAPKHNPPDNANQVWGWRKVWDSLPDSPLKFEHIESLKASVFSVEGKGSSTLRAAWNKHFGHIQRDTHTVGVTVTPSVLEQRVGSRDQGVGSREIPPGGDAVAPPPPVLTNQEPAALRARKPRQVKLPAARVPASLGWGIWKEVYRSSRRDYGDYTPATCDGKIMNEVIANATDIVRGQLRELGMPSADPEPMVAKLLRHWFISFMRDDGEPSPYIANDRHSFRHIGKRLSKYGMPKSDSEPRPAPAKPIAPEPPSEPGIPPAGFDSLASQMLMAPGGVN